MKNLMVLFLAFCALGTMAQDISQEPDVLSVPENVKIDASLYQVGQIANTSIAEAENKMENMNLRMRGEDSGARFVNVEIVYKNDYLAEEITDMIDVSYLESLGFKVESSWMNRASVWVEASEILSLGAKLGSDYFMFAVRNYIDDNQGPAEMNSSTYQTASTGGNGIRIGVIDSGFMNLQTAINAGAAPTPAYMWRAGGQVNNVSTMSVDTRHGTGCLETVFDHAPNATYEIYDSANMTEFGNAVAQCITNGVDIISHSKSYYNLGWGDNSGSACAAVNSAANSIGGIVVFTSAGNRANTHWEGDFEDDDGDDWHEWSGADELNNITVGNGGYCRASLSWNPVANSDYNVYIYRLSDNVILASSTNSGTTFEDCGWTNSTGSSVNVGIAVKRMGTASPVFEVFSHNSSTSDYQYAVASGSNTSPSNSTYANVISVGAVPFNLYGSDPGTGGIVASYSSQGPTNSGALAPDVSAPTNTTTVAYGGAFTGTSCATPNAAGMAAAFWSANSYLDNYGVTQILLRKAQLYKDWGANGDDNVYGKGGLFLYDYMANTRYLYRGGGNSTGALDRPFYNFEQAQSHTPNNGRVVILGGTYPENLVIGGGTGANRKVTYVSLIQSSIAN
ncbi:S8 family serine peptidase [Marinilongibacter aquaticus]|uniref:S8 family serine peptidase n=1 Tax=Marinilongibacter aquaticus TaxID=2975157 RepID=UPI0021BDE4CF|nr:S8 family serine peptidase [Marinilongibacter aquaticus]UBM57778.1 S8 family serine peptidase [Marinilongibacter aquaticus]